MSVALIALLAAVLSAAGAFFAAYGTLSLDSLREHRYGFRYSHLPSPRGYRDEDGQTDDASLSAFADRIPKALALLFIAVDLVICAVRLLGIAGLPLGPPDSVARVLTATQLASLFLTPNPTERFSIGCYAAVSCLVGASTTTYQIYQSTLSAQNSVNIAAVGDVILLVLAAASALSLPRRPAIVNEGRSVDAQYTVSALQRYSFSWVYNLLYKAKVEGRLEYEDLPSLHWAARTAPLLNKILNVLNNTRWESLWVKVFLAHKGLFCQQWALTVASSFALYAPQLCMLKILRLLEQRHQQDFAVSSLWLWVTVLGLSKILQVAIESWLEWINWAMLSVPVRSQLAAMIFQKSLRTKDIKGVKATNTAEKRGGASTELEDSDEGGFLMEEWREDDTQKSQKETSEGQEEDPSSQAIINLVGVDTVRISNFAAENNLFLSTVANLALALSILFHLLGWLGVCAGIVMPILLTPLNLWATRKYSDAQDSVMTIRDERMALTGEALRGIRQIKFSAVEDKWQSMVFAIRDRELKQQWWVYMLVSGLLCIWMAAPLLFSTVSLAIHAWQNGSISPSTAFTSLAIFGTLEYALSVVPNLITEAVDANVSVQRIQKHLQRQERVVPETVGDHVTFDHVTVQWPSEDHFGGSFALRELDLRFPKGELSVICGKTGSGKTLLLASILGESDVIQGSIRLPANQDVSDEEWIDPASVAYVAQIPWTENATIRDNILFGLPFVQKRYEQVIWACALERDIEIMPDGEFTEVGANGINLSGGQRWRLTFARALYSRAATLVLDDIFSAVDAHVGRHLLQHALLGSLATGRTRILATHHEELVLPATSYLVRLHETNGSSYASATSLTPKNIDRADTTTLTDFIKNNGISRPSRSQDRQSSDTLQEVDIDPVMPPKPTKFVEDEVRERGHIKWQVYKAYMVAAGGFRFWTTALGVFVLAQGTLLGRAWLVKVWTEQDVRESPTMDAGEANTTNPTPATNDHLYFFLGGYLIVSLLAAVLAGVKFVFFCRGSIEASRRLFESFTQTVLRAPLRWLDTVPQGRILNRFAADFSSVDSKLARDVSHFWESGLAFLAIVIAGMFVSVYMLLPSVLLGVICVYYTAQYLPGAREIKRLEATAQSPVFEHFGSTLIGLLTIRCFKKDDDYQMRMHDKLDEYARATWHLWLTQRWMSFRMGTIGAVFAFAVASVVAARSDIEAALAGFALSFSLQYSEAVVETIRRYSAMELDMNSTERIVEYTDMPTEDRSGIEPPPTWPSHGRIRVEGLEAGYAPGLPSVLKGLTFDIEPGQRIGVVGRTGSGKSSFTLALFRFIEARSGRITIDGTDIAKIGLQALRSRLSIIPQDPVLFSGTLRTNLDVFNQYDDEVLKQSLRDVHLLATVDADKSRNTNTKVGDDNNLQGQNIFESLDSAVSEGGLSLSQGQRQLVCLARAIITRPKIMVLDEATSAVDMGTDALIQESIREQFRGSTLIVIAHRLSTIVDFDKIVVLDNGNVVEFDEPVRLLQNPDGEFRRMLNESGEKEKLERLIYKS
ncbi:P-loop containing nucleoside triphosphate hydrolase protein [Xylaria acuta]|nr:P-loop containing nucleoside triphosphate hydrolase protein [Xylaria acuta]